MLFYCSSSFTTDSVTNTTLQMAPKLVRNDPACAGKLQLVRNWFDLLLKLGPSYGYFPEPFKCFIIVALNMPEAHSLFKDLGVQVTTGYCFLGGIIGNDESK